MNTKSHHILVIILFHTSDIAGVYDMVIQFRDEELNVLYQSSRTMDKTLRS